MCGTRRTMRAIIALTFFPFAFQKQVRLYILPYQGSQGSGSNFRKAISSSNCATLPTKKKKLYCDNRLPLSDTASAIKMNWRNLMPPRKIRQQSFPARILCSTSEPLYANCPLVAIQISSVICSAMNDSGSTPTPAAMRLM